MMFCLVFILTMAAPAAEMRMVCERHVTAGVGCRLRTVCSKHFHWTDGQLGGWRRPVVLLMLAARRETARSTWSASVMMTFSLHCGFSHPYLAKVVKK